MSATDVKYSFYSLRPLCTAMMQNGAIPVKKYVSGIGLSGTTSMAFVGDIEVLARTFLEAMDRVIAPFAGNNAAVPPALVRILTAKESLVGAIPIGIVNIEGMEIEPELAQVAAKATERALWKSLAHGFNSAAIMIERETHAATLHYPGSRESATPLAVRAIPSPVELIDQSVFATYPEAETAGEATQCKYSLSCFYEGIATDAIIIRLADVPYQSNPVYDDSKLFFALVQFTMAYPALSADIPDVYASEDAGNEVVLTAYNSFADMAESIASAWPDYVAPSHPSPIAGKGPYYALKAKHKDGYLHSVSLHIIDVQTTEPVLPALFVKNVNGKYEQLVMTGADAGNYTYLYKGRDESDGCSMLAEFVCTDIYSPQPVFEAIVARNWTEQVNSALVYPTAVSFAKPVSVYIEQFERIDINTSGANIADALIGFFHTILGGTAATPQTQIAVTYTYPMSPDDGAPWTSLPVMLLSRTVYNDELIAGLASATEQWRTTAQPPTTGHFSMKVTMYGATGEPVLILHEVTFR